MKMFLNSKSQKNSLGLLLLMVIGATLHCGGGSGVLSSKTTTSSSDAGKLIVNGGADVNASVVLSKDALPADAVVSLAEGKEVTTQDAEGFATLTQSTIRSQGQSVVISSTANIDPGQPMQLQIPLPSSGLALAGRSFGLVDNANIAIVYKIIDYAKKEMRIGIIPFSKIVIQGTNAIFSSSYFGVFQSIISDAPITETKDLAVNTPIVASNGKVLIDTPTSANIASMAPLAASLFEVSPDAPAQGDISLKIAWNSDRISIAKAEVRALGGTSAPAATCSGSSDLLIGTITDFSSASTTLSFASGMANGALFSFRLCIYGKNSKLTSSDILLSVSTRDTIAPPPLTTFTALRSLPSSTDVLISWTYPADTSDYAKMQIRRLLGNFPPAETCDAGDVIATYYAPLVNQQMNVSLPLGTSHGFRACLYDSRGNLQSSNTSITNVSPFQLTEFSGLPGVTNAGDIVLKFTWPSTGSSSGNNVEIKRLPYSPGVIPQCSHLQNEQYVMNFTNNTPSNSVYYTDQRNHLFGEAYSYRACVYDSSMLVNSSFLLNVPSRKAATQSVAGNDVTTQFLIPPPSNVPLTKLTLYRKTGTTSIDCFVSPSSIAGNMIQEYTNFSGGTLTKSETAVPTGTYSYTYCVQFPAHPTVQIDLPLTVLP